MHNGFNFAGVPETNQGLTLLYGQTIKENHELNFAELGKRIAIVQKEIFKLQQMEFKQFDVEIIADKKEALRQLESIEKDLANSFEKLKIFIT